VTQERETAFGSFYFDQVHVAKSFRSRAVSQEPLAEDAQDGVLWEFLRRFGRWREDTGLRFHSVRNVEKRGCIPFEFLCALQPQKKFLFFNMFKIFPKSIRLFDAKSILL